MKRIIVVAAGAAIAGLTACGHTAGPAAAPASHASHQGAVRVPVSCSEKYQAWTHGKGKGLVARVDAVSSAATVGDPHVLAAALKRARPAVASAGRHPMPGCADPRGYWYVLLQHVNAAVTKGSSASSIRASMQGVPQIEHHLTAELRQTAQ